MSQALQSALDHYRAERLAEAESACRDLLRADPKCADAYHLLGVIAHRAGKLPLAIALVETATQIDPSNPQFLSNLGEMCLTADRLDDAEDSLREAVELAPGFAAAHNNLGNVLKACGRMEEAAQSYSRALAFDPQLEVARLNLALLDLQRGNYAEGFAAYESRFEAANLVNSRSAGAVLAQVHHVPRWHGEDLCGRALLVWTEQGFGDSLMMLRYLPLLTGRGIGGLVIYCEPALARLAATFPEVDEVVSSERFQSRRPVDFHCPIMSLPLVFQTTLETIPATTPYLRVPDAQREHWTAIVSGVPRPRIGVVWASGKLTKTAQRDLGLANLLPLLKAVDAGFVSLQKSEKPVAGAPIVDWMDRCEDFLDTAALIGELDLVISVDTAVAHLAGALAKPVWLLNRFEGAWQWLTGREDSPWYPRTRIFTQAERGNWDDVMQRVAAELKTRFRSTRQENTNQAGTG